MSPLSSAIIATNWPDDILISHAQDAETKLFAGFMYLMRGGEIHRVLVNHTVAPFETAEAAEASMLEIVKKAQAFFQERGVNCGV